MRKEVRLIKRSQAVQKIIKQKEKELQKLHDECQHEVLTEFIDYKGNHTTKCLFCGQVVNPKEGCEYWFNLFSLSKSTLIFEDGMYWLLQQLFIIVANSNPKMSIKEVCENMEKKMNGKDSDYNELYFKAFWGRHD